MRLKKSHSMLSYLKAVHYFGLSWMLFSFSINNFSGLGASEYNLLPANSSAVNSARLPANTLNTEASNWDENPEALFTLASIYCNNEEWERLKGLTEALKSHEYLSDLSHYFIGRIALAENRLGTARREFELALKKRPEGGRDILAHIYFYKAICLKELNQIQLAKNEFMVSEELGFVPESAKELIQLAKFYTLWFEPSLTIALVKNYPDVVTDTHFELSALLGRAYLKMDLPKSAIESFSKSLAQNPHQAPILSLRANTYRQTGAYDAAITDINKAIDLYPNQPAQIYILGLINFELGNLEDAFSEFSAIQSDYSENSSFLLLYASLAQALGEIPTAKSALKLYFLAETQTLNENALYLSLLINKTLGADSKYWDIYPSLKIFNGYINHAPPLETLLPNIYKANLSYYWAQAVRQQGHPNDFKTLLKKTMDLSKENTPEYLLAQWQLKGIED